MLGLESVSRNDHSISLLLGACSSCAVMILNGTSLKEKGVDDVKFSTGFPTVISSFLVFLVVYLISLLIVKRVMSLIAVRDYIYEIRDINSGVYDNRFGAFGSNCGCNNVSRLRGSIIATASFGVLIPSSTKSQAILSAA